MTVFQRLNCRTMLCAGLFIAASFSPAANAETAHLEAIEGGFKTTHGLGYTITSNQMVAKGPTHRSDVFGETPFEISLAALFSDDGAVMIHAERVADQSGASNYSNLARSDWPDDLFRHSGVICLEVAATDVEGEHDLEWLRDRDFDPTGPMVYVQFYATTADFNDEIVITLLARVPSCSPELDPGDRLKPLKESVVITRIE